MWYTLLIIYLKLNSKNTPFQPVPYESGIAGDGLTPGKALLIYGIPEKKAKRFNLNLLKKNGDIALHLNPRFDEKVILCSSEKYLSSEFFYPSSKGK